MPRGKLQIKNIAHAGDPEASYEVIFGAEDSDLWTTSVPDGGMEEFLYQRLRLQLEDADQLLAGVRNQGHASIDGIEISETDLVGGHMEHLRNDAA